MPEYPTFPSRDEDEGAPSPERIIDRIIRGQLGSTTLAAPSPE